MPVVHCLWPELEETVTNLERGRNEVLQIIESPQGVAILYRKRREVETR